MMQARPIFARLTALADPTRSRLLLLLDRHELTVGELCISLQLPQSTVSRHLKVLGDDGWVDARGEGTSRFYTSSISELDSGARDLWMIVRAELGSTLGLQADNRRAESAVAKRRAKVRLFFEKAADLWDVMRDHLVSGPTDLVP